MSNDPCADMYPGPSPFSEPETLALARFIQTFDNIKLYIAFHSYGELILYPYVRIFRFPSFLFCLKFFLNEIINKKSEK